MNDDSIATHMYWHVLSVLLTGQKKKKKKKMNNRHHSSLCVRLFGCYYFKSCRCWTWCGSDTLAHSFTRAWRACATISKMAYRRGRFVFTDIWPDNISSDHSLLMFYWSCLVTCTVSMLVWLVWGKVECAYGKSPVWCGRIDIPCLVKKKRDRSSSCEWGGQSQLCPCVNSLLL